MRINTKNTENNESGFTLIEISVVMLIMGVLIASVAQLYTQRIKFLKVEDTKTNIELDVTNAVANFLEVNGRYPCPASLTAIPGDANYGRETNCGDGAVLTLGADGLSTTGGIRIGGVPFKELNLEESDTIDGYRNRLIYAVTEPLGVQATFDPTAGTIQINDDQGNLLRNDFHFILYSTGENGAGGFTREGVQATPCPAGTIEQENCDFNDVIFTSSQTGVNNNAAQNDDVVAFTTHTDMPKWETTTDPTEISTKLPGSLGIGPGASDTPSEEVDLTGVARALDDPHTAPIEGKIMSSNICKYGSSNGVHCFPSNLIGGDHPNMDCPAGQHMTGIRFGKAVCSNREITIKCPPGIAMIGINPNGTIKCDIPPPGSCPKAQVAVCSTIQTLFSAPHGTERLVSAGVPGNPKTKRYRCINGTWEYQNYHGFCTCTEKILDQWNADCTYPSKLCGKAFSGGQYQVTTTQKCPSGRAPVTKNRTQKCSCLNSTAITKGACPANFNEGEITYENTHDCNTFTCSGPKETQNTCECKKTSEMRNANCNNNPAKQYQEERAFLCLNGSKQPGTQTNWAPVPGSIAANCTCESSNYTIPKECPPGEIGQLETQVTLTCLSNPTLPPVRTEVDKIITPCEPAPPVICRWKKINWPAGNPLVSHKTGIENNTERCDCVDDIRGIKPCYKEIGSKFQQSSCQCTS